jgi:hypothetical protein
VPSTLSSLTRDTEVPARKNSEVHGGKFLFDGTKDSNRFAGRDAACLKQNAAAAEFEHPSIFLKFRS